MTDESAETRFHGVGVSPGIARGNIQVMRDELEEIDRYSIAPSQVSAEIARFEWIRSRQVLTALGKQGDFKDNVLKLNIPRNDLHVVVDGVATPTWLGTMSTTIPSECSRSLVARRSKASLPPSSELIRPGSTTS